jgi:hypothetical protein
VIVRPDSAALRAIGSNVLEPAKRKPTVEAGWRRSRR